MASERPAPGAVRPPPDNHETHAAPSAARRRWLGLAALAALAGGLGAFAAWRHYTPTAGERGAADLLLALELPAPDGAAVALAQWRGRPLVVNFWATWCAPCIEEMPELSALQTEYGAAGLQIVGLGVDSPDNIRRFSGERPVSYPLLIAGAGGAELARRFGNESGGLPYTVVVDRSARVVDRILGRFELDALRESVESVLA